MRKLNTFTKLLARKLKKQQADSTIYKIRDFESFYQRLYSKIPEDNENKIDSFLDALKLSAMTEDQNNVLGAEITMKELNGAIKN